MIPDESDVRRWSWALVIGVVFVIGTAFGMAGSCFIGAGCASQALPPEPDYVVTEVTVRDAGHDAREAEAAPWDGTLPWFGVPDPDHTYVPHRMR